MKKFLLHPFLFALYAPLFLYSQNLNFFREEVLVAPILLTLILTGVIYLTVSLILRNKTMAALVSSLIILIFFSYSRIRELLPDNQHPDRWLLIIILLTAGFFIFLLFRYHQHLLRLNKLATYLALILFCIAVFNVAFFEIKSGRAFTKTDNEEAADEGIKPAVQKPDIYYFILDRYAGEKTFKLYGFDNSGFYSFLKDKGFYIADESTSNYPKTFLSIGATLNLDYLDFLTAKTNGGNTSDESYVTPLVQNNKVVKFLKKKGYTYIHVGSGWDPTRSNKNADRNFIMSGGSYLFKDEFMSGFLQTTLAAPILKKIFPDPTAVSQNPKNNDHRSRVLYEFDTFNVIPQLPGPKFVFAHILLPHDPYILDSNCKPLTEKEVAKRSWTQNYLNHIGCANQKTKEAIEKILAASAAKPIIIIQADEGPMPMKYPVPFDLAWAEASDDTLKEKFPILNAYLLPGLKKNPVYPSITSVNTFRLIFNNYFGTNYPLLPDKNIIFDSKDSYYKFTDITEKLRI